MGKTVLMNSVELTNSLIELKRRCQSPLPGHEVHRKFAPELAYGRHRGPVCTNAHEAAVVLAVIAIDNQWTIPLILRSDRFGDHRGQISLPGGRLETNENPWFGAMREFREELGYRGRDLELIAPLTPLYVYASNHRVQPYLALCEGTAAFEPNEDEVAQLICVPIDRLANQSVFQVGTMQRGTSQYDAPGFRIDDHFVWGATAMVLGEFIALYSGGQ